MARRRGTSRSELVEVEVEDVPGWVLGPPRGGHVPDDPALNAEWRAEFHAWRAARRAWLAEHAPHLSWVDLHDERRRRMSVVRTSPRGRPGPVD